LSAFLLLSFIDSIIARVTGPNNLIATTNFFVVLPSFVITLNPRDWRGPMAKLGGVSKNKTRHFSPAVPCERFAPRLAGARLQEACGGYFRRVGGN
jgi:hypothetical protein